MRIETSSLALTHIYDGEEVVSGGPEGQAWVATFCTRTLAAEFILFVQSRFQTIEVPEDEEWRLFVAKRHSPPVTTVNTSGGTE